MRQGWSGIALICRLGISLVLVFASIASSQDPATARITREASNQAAEADRLFKKGDFAAALPLYQAERESRSKLGDDRYEAYAYRAIGCCLGELEEEAAAIEALKAAKVLDLKRDDPGFAGYDDLLIARALSRLDRDTDALKSLAEALPRLSQAADRDHQVEARLLMARCLINLGRLDLANAQRLLIVKLLDELDLPNLSAEFAEIQATLDRRQGCVGLAFERLSDARAYYQAEQKLPESAKVDRSLAETLVELGLFEAAEAMFSISAEEFHNLGDEWSSGEALMALASVRLDLKKPTEAVEAATLAEARFQAVGEEEAVIRALVVRSQSLDIAGDRAGAEKAVDRALTLSGKVDRDRPEEAVRLLLLAADLAARSRDSGRVEFHLKAAKQAAERSIDPRWKALVAERSARLGSNKTK